MVSNGSFVNSRPYEACRIKCIMAGYKFDIVKVKGIFHKSSLYELKSNWSGC